MKHRLAVNEVRVPSGQSSLVYAFNETRIIVFYCIRVTSRSNGLTYIEPE